MGFAGSWAVPDKLCYSCKSAAAAVFCRADAAFLCLGCDSRIHGASKLSARHERVWMCEVCERAPAAVTCKADAAALCVSCDADIHCANPLARRHERVPVEPFLDAAESIAKAVSAFNFLAVPGKTGSSDTCGGACQNEELEAASWLFPNTANGAGPNKIAEGMDAKVAASGGGDVFFNDVETFLDLEYGNNSMDRFHGSATTDSLVPVQTKSAPAPVAHPSSENCFDINFCRSKLTSFSYLSQSVSSSSLDVGVVPEGNSMSDISYPFVQSLSGNSTDPSVTNSAATTATTTVNQPTPVCGMDREARVLRYREKRKNRKFEKTIRYASRKAYAETRPRIKGRFAKRTEIESEVDNIYGTDSSAAFMADSRYGVVPTF